MSWFNLDRQWDDALSEGLEDDELGFGAMFMAGIDFKPGYGLILSGLAMAGIAVAAAAAFFVAYSRMEKLPITVTVSPSAAPPANPPASSPAPGQWPLPPSADPPPPAGPPSGQWPTA
jgi:hypothetical protein